MTQPSAGSHDPLKPDRFELERLKKLEAIEALGLDPWGQRFDGHVGISAARDKAPRSPASRAKRSELPAGSCSATTRES